MKKLFLMFAVAGMIASCTGNGTTSGSASASGETKDGATAEVQKEEKDTIKGPATIDGPTWSIDVPEGWLVNSERMGEDQESSSYLDLKPIERPEGMVGLLGVVVESFPFKPNTVEQDQKTFCSSFNVDNPKPTDETIAGVKFSKIVKPATNGGGIITHLTAPLEPNGNVSIEVRGYELDDLAIKAMLESFKLKPAETEEK